jgi:nascent polypeptide-associated complex subunit alpha
MNPKQMEMMMRKMGIKTEEIDATEVIIIRPGGQMVIKEPKVTIMTVQGERTYQITGREVTDGESAPTKGKKKGKKKEPVPEPEPEPEPEEEIRLPYLDEDVTLVMEQTGCSEERAKKALEKAGGQPAEAILFIMSG